MKILHHNATGAYRLLLRREQVHKVVLNQLITPAMELAPMSMTLNARCWGGMNYAEEEPKLEKLAVRFKVYNLTMLIQ
jgi:E3 SUMO-protein ligase RanBP2